LHFECKIWQSDRPTRQRTRRDGIQGTHRRQGGVVRHCLRL
jgi:hypothetical protein